MLEPMMYDCAIIVMLSEEMRLFIECAESINIVEETASYTTFTFCDKQNIIRKGIIYSGGTKMGNTEACSLMYKFTRNYKAKLYINLGVACAIRDTNIGDVVLVSECTSLSEKNATDSSIQITSSEMKKEYIDAINSKINNEYKTKFRNRTQRQLNEIRNKLKKHNVDESVKKAINDICKHTSNEIKLGTCASVPYVVKDQETLDEIKSSDRKLHTIDMEAYYFVHWHKLIQQYEADKIDADSNIIVIKSPSDNGIGNDKSVLEEIGTRTLAMQNLADFTLQYLTEMHSFEGAKEKDASLYDYITTTYCEPNIDKLDDDSSYEEFNHLCQYFANLEIKEVKDNIEFVCQHLQTANRAVYIKGQSGTGKSTFLSYVYKTLTKNPEIKCIYLDISKLIYKNDNLKSLTYCLYLLERLMKHPDSKELILIVDSADCGNFVPKSDKDIAIIRMANILRDYKKKSFSICVSDEHTLQKYLNPEIKESHNIEFNNFSAFDDNFNEILEAFYAYFIQIDSECPRRIIHTANELLREAKLPFVDFRLLKMIFENHNIILEGKSFGNFVEVYFNNNRKSDNLQDIINLLIQNIKEKKDVFDVKIANHRLITNLYTRSYLIANCFCYIIENNDSDALTQYTNIFSSNFNIFLKHIVNESSLIANGFCKKALSVVNTNKIERSTKVQIFFNIFSLGDVISQGNLKTYKEALESSINQITLTQECGINNILEYRTIAIILAKKWGGEYQKYLRNMNELMLEDKGKNYIALYDVMFHFYYYSQDEFTFDKVEEMTKEYVNKSMLINTYKELRYELSVKQDAILDDEYYKMNLITLAYIYKDFNQLPIFKDYKDECKALLENILDQYKLEPKNKKLVEGTCKLIAVT